ncbi:MAG TPA: hypothetical protein PL196_11290, partial [Burkholderiaceae bacterium]|nr:hypothetical protein [Burkholderiaceae bacterium]
MTWGWYISTVPLERSICRGHEPAGIAVDALAPPAAGCAAGPRAWFEVHGASSVHAISLTGRVSTRECMLALPFSTWVTEKYLPATQTSRLD